jgi:hypothetical protein
VAFASLVTAMEQLLKIKIQQSRKAVGNSRAF